MSEPIENKGAQDNGAEVTFTQTEVDALVSREKAKAVAKATKGMPTEEELTAFRTWKDSQQTEKDKLNNVTKERDTALTQLKEAQEKLEQYDREKYLSGKGIPAEDVDYYAFKIGQLVTDKKSFEQAAEEYLKDKNISRVRVEMTAGLSGNNSQPNSNDTMNALIRDAFR